jgi:hypothetical protein
VAAKWLDHDRTAAQEPAGGAGLDKIDVLGANAEQDGSSDSIRQSGGDRRSAASADPS